MVRKRTCPFTLTRASKLFSTVKQIGAQLYLLPENSTIGRADDRRPRSKATCITVHKKGEGFGMNLQVRMNAVREAHKMGGWYCHHNHTLITHNTNQEKARVIMGFPAPAGGCDGCTVIHNRLKEQSPHIPKEVRRELKAVYNMGDRTPPETCKFDPAKENVAVHIRLGDLKIFHLDRSIASSVYIRQMQLLRTENENHHAPKQLLFHIFSEGPDEQFDEFLSPSHDVILHNKDDALPSFQCMVTAQRLVTARSSFSKTAAIFSNGIVYHYDPKQRAYSPVSLNIYYLAGMVAPTPAPFVIKQRSRPRTT